MPYNPNFISGHRIALPEIVGSNAFPGSPLHYHHHSVVMNPNRKFAFYSASNIDGSSWKPIDRKGGFRKDSNLEPEFQLGTELYESINGGGDRENDFDEGHLTSFQEVLWGEEKESTMAGADTFFYTNCVPQHGSLNRGAWRSLEQYLVKKGADPNELKISVMTGPLLLPHDPYFINAIDGELVRVPVAFWKVIYYKTEEGLQAVGFMMSQRNLLLEDQTITYDKDEVTRSAEEELKDVFMNFPKATTYQVSVSFIEKVAGIKFFHEGVKFPFKQQGSRELIFKRIEVERPRGMEDEVSFADSPIDYQLENILI
jgi:endonuclease G, mitochondrial